MNLPIKNRPVVTVTECSANEIRRKLAGQDTLSVLALPELGETEYKSIKTLAATLAKSVPSPILVVLEQDMAKALGQAIALEAPPDASISPKKAG